MSESKSTLDFTQPFSDPDAEALAQVLGAYNGTLPEAMDIVRRDVAVNTEARDRAIAAMRKWRAA